MRKSYSRHASNRTRIYLQFFFPILASGFLLILGLHALLKQFLFSISPTYILGLEDPVGTRPAPNGTCPPGSIPPISIRLPGHTRSERGTTGTLFPPPAPFRSILDGLSYPKKPVPFFHGLGRRALTPKHVRSKIPMMTKTRTMGNHFWQWMHFLMGAQKRLWVMSELVRGWEQELRSRMYFLLGIVDMSGFGKGVDGIYFSGWGLWE